MEYCPHCMKPAEGPVCGNCGGQVDWKAGAGQLSVGSLLRGSSGHTYQIGAARGQGGFGITYAAMDLDSGERVAVKEYFPTRCAQRTQLNQVTPMTGQMETYQGGMKSFLEEAMMLSAVGAVPSVVTVKDYFEANGTAYLVMEYVDGVPLHQVVAKRGKLPADELMPKFRGLLRDLDILHRAGVIHRDISPDNLIWQPDGTLKLLDFGSARSLQDGKSMTVLLKAGFSPVEQYQTRGQGPWTDVYALAGTLYYCLTGVIPPSAVDRLDQDNLKPPTLLGAELTAEQEEALLWGLTVQPKSRPVSMDVFSQRLFPKAASKPFTIPKPDFVQKAAELGKTIKSTVEAAKPEPKPEPVSEPEPKVEEAPVVEPTPKKPKKKLLLFILLGIAAIALLAGIIAGIVYLSTHGTTEDGFVYQIRYGSQAEITGYTGQDSAVMIPDDIKNKPVVGIGYQAFANCRTMTSLTIPDSLEWFAYQAFENCTSLRLVIMESDSSLFDSDFDGCTKLRCILLSEQEVCEKYIEKDFFKNMPDVVLCYVGQDTVEGQLRTAVVDDLGVVYAITNQQKAVVLSLPDGMSADVLADRTVNGCPVVLADGSIPGVEEPAPEPVYGTTEDGYEYMITADRTQCYITGYTGAEEYLYTPDEVDGVPITVIAEDAFAGNTAVESIWMPAELREIMTGAFHGCSNLRDVYIYSQINAASGTFSGCSRLRCVVRNKHGVSVAGLGLPMDCKVYDEGVDTGAGALDYVVVDDDGNIYAVTQEETAVLMSVAANCTELDIPDDVVWVYEEALDGVSSSVVIGMPEELLFPPELVYAADWQMKDDQDQFTLAYNWLMTCMMCDDMSGRRNLAMDTSRELVEAATLRVAELAQVYDAARPDGSNWSTVLNDCNVDWSYASSWRFRLDGLDNDAILEKLEKVAAGYAEPEPDNDNKYYTDFAVGFYYDAGADQLYILCLAVED